MEIMLQKSGQDELWHDHKGKTDICNSKQKSPFKTCADFWGDAMVWVFELSVWQVGFTNHKSGVLDFRGGHGPCQHEQISSQLSCKSSPVSDWFPSKGGGVVTHS